MPARLICKSEEYEEAQGTPDQEPAVELEQGIGDMVGFPFNGWDLWDFRICLVGVGPADPRAEPRSDVEGKNPSSHWDSPKYLDSGQTHQAEVATLIEATVRRHHLAELTTTPVEVIDAQSCR